MLHPDRLHVGQSAPRVHFDPHAQVMHVYLKIPVSTKFILNIENPPFSGSSTKDHKRDDKS